MISFKELMGSHTISEIPIGHQQNGQELLKRINIIRDAYGLAMKVTSCYRSKEEHIQIYEKLNKDREAKGLPPRTIPWASRHLEMAAVDIADPDGKLMKWCRDNVDILEKAQVWCEDDDSVPRVHFQIFPPKSGKRFFLP